MASDDVAVEELKKLEVKDDEDDVTPGYKAPAKVDLQTIKDLDKDDESLQKYKKDLLGDGDEKPLDEGGSNVLVKELIVRVEDRDDIVLDLADVSKLRAVRMKEGTTYRLIIKFRVQREIVSGLRFLNTVTRKGIKVDKSNYMVGSYGPKTDVHNFTAPAETAPAGMISRGEYKIKSKFTDDDQNVYLEWDWSLHVAKDWK